jgi:hypothetical protein
MKHDLITLSSGKEASNLVDNLPFIDDLPSQGFFKGRYSAYGATAALRGEDNNKKDIAYEGLSSACSAFLGWEQEEYQGLLSIKNRMIFHVPLVVVEGQLFSVELQDKNQIDLKNIDDCRVKWCGNGPERDVSIDVVTETKLGDYLLSVIEELGRLSKACEQKPSLYMHNAIYHLDEKYKRLQEKYGS